MEILVGTYDEVILGYRLVKVGEDIQIETNFTDHSHAGCVKCLAVSSRGILASGSTDETIRLFNLRKQKELGSLIHHTGSLTGLEFHRGFLLSTSEDGNLCLWKMSTWECLRTFKGHQAAINSVSVHPSGRLAFTVGRDRSLRTWNLITGRSAFITNIKQVADIVKWSPDGERYVVVVNNRIDVYTVETADVQACVQTEARINSLDFINNNILCYGGEGGKVFVHNIVTGTQCQELDTKTVRIKGLCITPSPYKDDHKILSIASSEGLLKLYDVVEDENDIVTEPLLQYNTGFRLTCMTVYCSGHNADVGETIQESHESTDVSVPVPEDDEQERDGSGGGITINAVKSKKVENNQMV